MKILFGLLLTIILYGCQSHEERVKEANKWRMDGMIEETSFNTTLNRHTINTAKTEGFFGACHYGGCNYTAACNVISSDYIKSVPAEEGGYRICLKSDDPNDYQASLRSTSKKIDIQKQCKEFGFKEETEGFANCQLELTILANDSSSSQYDERLIESLDEISKTVKRNKLMLDKQTFEKMLNQSKNFSLGKCQYLWDC